MGAVDDSDIERQRGSPAPDGADGAADISRLIRQEVRAVVREQIMAAASSSTSRPSILDSEPAPPSYDSAARLLASDAVRALATTEALTDDEDDDLDLGGNGIAAGKSGPKKHVLPKWLRAMIVLLPFVFILGSMPTISMSGHDPLNLSIVSFFLVMSTYLIVLILIVSFGSPLSFLIPGFLSNFLRR
jgi:hypothetical protein